MSGIDEFVARFRATAHLSEGIAAQRKAQRIPQNRDTIPLARCRKFCGQTQLNKKRAGKFTNLSSTLLFYHGKSPKTRMFSQVVHNVSKNPSDASDLLLLAPPKSEILRQITAFCVVNNLPIDPSNHLAISSIAYYQSFKRQSNV